jgi:PAS domain S-box-containing protein
MAPGESRFYAVSYEPQTQRSENLVVVVIVDITERKQAQEAIQAERNQLRTLIDLLPDQIYIKDTECRFLVVNDAVAKVLGRHPLEIIGRSDSDFFPPELAARFRATEEGVLAGRPLINDEATVVSPTGQTVTLLTTKMPLRNERGEICGLVGIARNITEHKQAVKVVLESEQRMRVLFELSPDAVFVEDLEGFVLDVNTAACRLHGLSRNELIGKSVLDLVPPGHREIVKADFAKLVAGQSIRVAESWSLTADGQHVPVEIKANHITYSGKPALLVNARDITERKAAEAEARARDEHFRMLIENASDIITVIALDGMIEFQSPSVRRILGYQPEEMTRQSAFAFIHPEDAERVTAAIQKTISQPGEVVTVEYRIRHQDGTWRTLQSSGRYTVAGATAGSIVVNSRDITESRVLEEQLRQAQKMEAIGILAGGVAHDFNNILTIIQGNASLLLPANTQPDEQEECAHQIIRAADRAAGLTRQLLLFSRKQVLQPVNLNLNQLVAQTAKMLRRFLGEDIVLETDLAPQLPLIHADPGTIDQVLVNLAVNSRDAMPRGGQLTLATSVEALPDEGNKTTPPKTFVCLTVKDTGCGIHPEHVDKIFDPFFTTKDVGKGTGLGLATVYGIVKQHDGRVTVESSPGQGATFRVYFPTVAGATVATPPEASPSKAFHGTETILVVEDEAPVRRLVCDVLRRYGYTVLQAESGPAALALCQSLHPDFQLLFTDVIMPGGLNGHELAKQLQQHKPGLKVLYTSGYSADVVGADFQLQEGVNFIPKPFTTRRLGQVVRDCLDRN